MAQQRNQLLGTYTQTKYWCVLHKSKLCLVSRKCTFMVSCKFCILFRSDNTLPLDGSLTGPVDKCFLQFTDSKCYISYFYESIHTWDKYNIDNVQYLIQIMCFIEWYYMYSAFGIMNVHHLSIKQLVWCPQEERKIQLYTGIWYVTVKKMYTIVILLKTSSYKVLKGYNEQYNITQ